MDEQSDNFFLHILQSTLEILNISINFHQQLSIATEMCCKYIFEMCNYEIIIQL